MGIATTSFFMKRRKGSGIKLEKILRSSRENLEILYNQKSKKKRNCIAKRENISKIENESY